MPETMPSRVGSLRSIHSTMVQPSGAGHGGDDGVKCGDGGQGVRRPFRTGIEADPAEQQHRGADHRKGQVVRRHEVTTEAAALAQNQGGDEAGNTGIDVDDGTAGEVEDAESFAENHRPTPSGRSGA